MKNEESEYKDEFDVRVRYESESETKELHVRRHVNI